MAVQNDSQQPNWHNF